MPRQVTGTMVQILAEKETSLGEGRITDKLMEEADSVRTELGVPKEAMKELGGCVLINCGAYSVGLQIGSPGQVAGSYRKEQRHIITAEGFTTHGKPLPEVTEALQRLGYVPKSGSPIPVGALGLL